MSAGKGDKPRNIFSREFRENYDDIDWTGPIFQPCHVCGKLVADWKNPERQLKTAYGETIYICAKDAH